MAALLRTTSQRLFAMGVLHALILVCIGAGCLAEECPAETEALYDSHGVSFIQTYAQSSRLASQHGKAEHVINHVSPDDEAGQVKAQEYLAKLAERSEEAKRKAEEKSRVKEEPETKKADEKKDDKEKAEDKKDDKAKADEKKDDKEKAEDKKDDKEKAEDKKEDKAKADDKKEDKETADDKDDKDTAEDTKDDKAESGAAGKKEDTADAADSKDAKKDEAKEEGAAATDDASSETAATAASGAETTPTTVPTEGGGKQYKVKMKKLMTGWVDAVRDPEKIRSKMRNITSKSEFYDAVRGKYGVYESHRSSRTVQCFLFFTPIWFVLFIGYALCFSKSNNPEDDVGGFQSLDATKKLSDISGGQRLGQFMESPWFRMIVLTCVIVDIFCLLVIYTVNQTDYLNPKYLVQGHNWAGRLRDINVFILCGFLLEQYLHGLAHGKYFFRHFWYMVDLVSTYLALLAACVLDVLFPLSRWVSAMEMLPLLRLWSVVAIVLDLLIVTALAEQEEDEEIMEEEDQAEAKASGRQASGSSADKSDNDQRSGSGTGAENESDQDQGSATSDVSP